MKIHLIILDLWPGVKEIEGFDPDCLPDTGG